jgi:ribosome-associated protein
MNKAPVKSLSGKKLVDIIRSALNEAIAQEITSIDLSAHQGAADWFIICQADNTVHARAVADRVLDDLSEHGTKPWQREGMEEGRWILLDFSDVIVHIMLPELRSYYRLEELWKQGSEKRNSSGF